GSVKNSSGGRFGTRRPAARLTSAASRARTLATSHRISASDRLMASSSRDPAPGSSIAGRFEAVRRRIAEACRAAGRDPAGVALTAVTKTQPPEALEAALAGGQRLFGENRVQEAQGHWADLRDRDPDLELRL